MSHRAKQLGSVIQRAVQSVLERGLSDPRVRGIITVTGVEVAQDLKTAVVNVSVVPEEREKTTLHGLRSASRFIRRQAAELVAVHRMPTLDFRIDERIKKEAGTLRAINEALSDLDKRALQPGEPAEPDDTDASTLNEERST